MKRIVSLTLTVVLVLGLIFTLASCGGGISGTYEGKVDFEVAGMDIVEGSLTFNFDGNNVEISAAAKLLGILGGETESFKATYKLGEKEDGTKTITFDLGDAESIKGVIKTNVALPFEQGDGYIKIAGIKYTKK